jgi:hypothetical protein
VCFGLFRISIFGFWICSLVAWRDNIYCQ